VRCLPVGRHALLVELDDDQGAQAAYDLIRRLAGSTAELGPPADVVPAERTVLIDGVSAPTEWRTVLLDSWAHRQAGDLEDANGPEPAREAVTIPVTYDGADIEEVAAHWRCDAAEVVRRHQEVEFTVAFCGFAPGFAYCLSEPPLPEVPRRRDPRTKVPAGAVGLAGRYCGVYPQTMPGGWQLIGTTSEVMFDPDREAPALLAPGDRVRFQAAP
jgi:KipI family sensor histidine kinase inhibitor